MPLAASVDCTRVCVLVVFACGLMKTKAEFTGFFFESSQTAITVLDVKVTPTAVRKGLESTLRRNIYRLMKSRFDNVWKKDV